jgi:hypothetical protein
MKKYTTSPAQWLLSRFLLLMLATHLWGCGASTGTSSGTQLATNSCSVPLISTGPDAGQCCPTGCPGVQAATPGTNNAVPAAQTAQAAQAAIQAADGGTSSGGATKAGSSAALAGGVIPGGATPNSALMNGLNSPTYPMAVNPALGSSNAAASPTTPSSGSGSGLSSQSTPTGSGALSGAGGLGTGVGTPGTAASIYSTGAGAGGAGKMATGFEGLGAMGGESGSGAKGGLQNFAGTTNPLDRAPASGNSDPADYFTRLNASDNLFKVIERRYQLTTSNWAAQQAAEIAKPAAVVPVKKN